MRKTSKTEAPGGKGRGARSAHVRRRSVRDRNDRSRQWSRRVTRESNALDLEPGVFTLDSPRKIAKSLKRSAERSRRRKADPYRSALSMLTFYINRAGRKLSAHRKAVLNRAKIELRKQCGRAR